MKKNNKLVSTAALALAGMTVATSTQVVAHADDKANVAPASADSTVTKLGNAVEKTNDTKATSQSAYDSAKKSEAEKLAEQAQQNKDKEAQTSQSNDQQYSAASDAATSTSGSYATAQSDALAQHDSLAASQATATSQAASQAVNSYANSQQAVASQAASQSATDTASYANSVANDPAKTADQERQDAKDTLNKDTNKANTDYANAQSAANSAQQDANQKATDKQNQANSQAKANFDKASQAADSNKTAADKAAKDTQNKAISDATHKKNAAESKATSTKTSADKAASDKQSKDTNAARHERDKGLDSKYQTNIDNATSKLDEDLDAVDEAKENIPATVTPTNDTNSSSDKAHDVKSEANLPTSIIDPKLPSSVTNDANADAVNFYGDSMSQDNSQVINGSLTDSQQKELADYAVTLVNSWRKAQGLNPVIWSEQVQDATVEIARLREKYQLGSNHTISNDTASEEADKVSDKNGLYDNSENLGYVDSLHTSFTMGLMKQKILMALTSMIYQDADSNWGHKKNLTNFEGMGFAVQHNTNPNDGSLFPYVLVFEGYTSADGKTLANEQTSMPNNAVQVIQAAKDSFGPTKAQLQAVENDKAAVAAAKQAMSDALGNKLTVYNNTMAQITKTYNDSIASNNATYQDAIQKAESSYANEVATANANYANALKQNQSAHDAAVKQAQSNYDTAIKQAQSNYDAAVKQAQATHDSSVAKASKAHDTALATAQSTYKTAYAAAHDETPAELKARHAKMMDAFKASEADKLAKLATQQAADLKNFKAQQDKVVSDFLAKQATERKNFVAKQASDKETFDKKQAKELSDLKTSLQNKLDKLIATDKADYQKAKEASDKYLDSLKPKSSNDNHNNDSNHSSNSNNGYVGKKTTDGKGNKIYVHGDTATIPTRSGSTHYSTGDNYSTGRSTNDTITSQSHESTGYVYDPATHKMIAVHYDSQGNAIDNSGRVVVSASAVKNNSVESQQGTAENGQSTDTTTVNGKINSSKKTNLDKLPQTGEDDDVRTAGFGAVMLSALIGMMTLVGGARRRHE